MNLRQSIHPTAEIREGCILGEFVVIGEGVVLGDRVEVGNNVTIHSGTRIGAGSRIGDNSVLGRRPAAAKNSTLELTDLDPLILGPHVTVGVGVILYAGTSLGEDSFAADSAQVRERCDIGSRVIIGRGSTVENDCSIGNDTKLQTAVYITAKTVIEENCFIAPGVITSNDNYVGRTEERHSKIRGPYIERGARLGAGAVLLPGVRVGQEALVAAGSVVTRGVPAYTLVMGSPAKPVRPVPPEQLIYPRGENGH